MNSGAIFRPATREDSRKIAELFRIASGGVVEYVWSTLAPEYPGLTPLEIGARRYARDEGAFSYRNCTVAELGGEVIGMRLTTVQLQRGRGLALRLSLCLELSRTPASCT
jgi:hypothetical protein